MQGSVASSGCRLDGHVVLITGAASGIGRATARICADRGATIALLDRDESMLEEAVTELAGSHSSYVADITNGDAVHEIVHEVVRTHGGLHGLVNNAGVMAIGDLQAIDPDTFRRSLDVNLVGAYLTSRAAVPIMDAGSASIVNIASVAGLVGIRDAVAYCAAKGGVIAMTRAMSADLAPNGIRVNAICPGTVQTPMIEEAIRARGDGNLAVGLQQTLTKYPAGRLGRPQDIAAAVAYLLSPDADFVTGAIQVVDGGMSSV